MWRVEAAPGPPAAGRNDIPDRVAHSLHSLSRRWSAPALALALLPVLLAAPTSLVRAQPKADPDWPCPQRLVPELALAAVWQGPALPPGDPAAAALPDVQALVAAALDRHLPLDELGRRVAAYAGEVPDARAGAIATLLEALVRRANVERAQMVEGIKRFARRQRALAEKIAADARRIRDLEAQGSAGALSEAAT
jgi:hypothetical protein